MLLLLFLVGFLMCSALYEAYIHETNSTDSSNRNVWFGNFAFYLFAKLFKSVSILMVIYGLIVMNTFDPTSVFVVFPAVKNIAIELAYRLSLFVFTVSCVLLLSNE